MHHMITHLKLARKQYVVGRAAAAAARDGLQLVVSQLPHGRVELGEVGLGLLLSLIHI